MLTVFGVTTNGLIPIRLVFGTANADAAKIDLNSNVVTLGAWMVSLIPFGRLFDALPDLNLLFGVTSTSSEEYKCPFFNRATTTGCFGSA